MFQNWEDTEGRKKLSKVNARVRKVSTYQHFKIRAFPRDLIPKRRLINMHAYNVFMSSVSSIFITYLQTQHKIDFTLSP